MFKQSVDCAHPFLSFIYFLLPSPSGINDIYQQVKAKRVQQEGRCVKCGKCGSNPRGRKRDINLNNCSVLKEGTHFSSNNTREKFRIRQDINCRSKNIIYTW